MRGIPIEKSQWNVKLLSANREASYFTMVLFSLRRRLVSAGACWLRVASYVLQVGKGPVFETIGSIKHRRNFGFSVKTADFAVTIAEKAKIKPLMRFFLRARFPHHSTSASNSIPGDSSQFLKSRLFSRFARMNESVKRLSLTGGFSKVFGSIIPFRVGSPGKYRHLPEQGLLSTCGSSVLSAARRRQAHRRAV